MLTIAKALDHFLTGDVSEMADTLMQRLKALERAIIDGHWRVASQYELIPDSDAELATSAEQREAIRGRHLQLKLEQGHVRSGSKSPTP